MSTKEVCSCRHFLTATEEGSGPEPYDPFSDSPWPPLLTPKGNRWVIAHVRKITFCPWCGKEPPTPKELAVREAAREKAQEIERLEAELARLRNS